jgi:hypothetical protein
MQQQQAATTAPAAAQPQQPAAATTGQPQQPAVVATTTEAPVKPAVSGESPSLAILRSIDAVRLVPALKPPMVGSAAAAATPHAQLQLWELHWPKLREPVAVRQLFDIVQQMHGDLSRAVASLVGNKYESHYVVLPAMAAGSSGGAAVARAPLAKFIRKSGKGVLVVDEFDHLIGKIKRHGPLNARLAIRDAQKKEVYWFRLSTFATASANWTKLHLYRPKAPDQSGEIRCGGIWKRHIPVGVAGESAMTVYDLVLPAEADTNGRLLVLAGALYADRL